MKINVIATGSKGNLYELIDSAGNCMLIEAGVPRQTYITNRAGKKPPEMAIVSHGHMDHSQFIGEYRALMPTFLEEKYNRSENWKTIGFKTKHGEGTTTVYLIKSLIDKDILFFGTDFEFGEYTELFDTLNYYNVENYLIECNYNDYLFHLATEEQRRGCSRHLSDNDVVNFIKKSGAKNPKIITIHGSNRLSADTHTKKYISSKLMTATVDVAVGAKGKQKNLFII